ncbi:MAG: (Fe-S)-binding protein [Candidatus Thorarchaeota archaeon]
MIVEDFADQLRMCASCPKMCRHVCPTYFAWRSDSPTPHGRALLIHYELVGTRCLDERGIEVLYQCLECSQCLTWCKPEVDIAEIVETRRREIVKQSMRPSALDDMAKVVETHHNPYGEPHDTRNNWLNPTKVDGRRLFYFTGCTAAYREKDIALSALHTLENAGFSVVISSEEYCCGSPLIRTGDEEAGLRLAQHNADMINSMECDEVVVTCPGCLRVLSTDYPKYGIELNKPVRHISEILAENLHNLGTADFDGGITYHDPCHLGRHSGIYDQPRSVIEHVSRGKLVEMERSRENAMCCGNGAGLRTLFPEHARKIGSERVEQAKRTGAKYLVTACPFCKNMLASQSDDEMEVMDLTEFIEKSRDVKSD